MWSAFLLQAEHYLLQYKPQVKVTPSVVNIGRVSLQRRNDVTTLLPVASARFAFTHQSTNLLERVAVCVSHNEPVLLVGETGVGKTSSVQFLSENVGQKLRVINMNQQSDSSDLLGGY